MNNVCNKHFKCAKVTFFLHIAKRNAQKCRCVYENRSKFKNYTYLCRVKDKEKTVRVMKRILFVCHGNICRSPMAEFVMKDLVAKAGREKDFYIESAATSTEEIGNAVYPPARRKLAEHGIRCDGKTARQMTRRDYERFDYIVGMDQWNLRNMRRLCDDDPEGKIHLLMEFTKRPSDVADPWYTGDFDATWRDVLEGCQALLEIL